MKLVGSITPVSDGKFLGDTRKKIGGFFGHDSEEELQRFGAGLSGFGAGLLTGGSDFGAALGNGFQKSQEAFHGMRKDQRQAALADHKIAMDEEKRDWEREKTNEWRRQVARARLLEDDPSLAKLKKDVGDKASGYDKNEDGDWVHVPKSAYSKLPEDVRKIHETADYLLTVSPEMTRKEALREAEYQLGIQDRPEIMVE